MSYRLSNHLCGLRSRTAGTATCRIAATRTSVWTAVWWWGERRSSNMRVADVGRANARWCT